jgi:hypothetical protein
MYNGRVYLSPSPVFRRSVIFMSKDWLLVYQTRRSSWLLLGLFDIVVEIFMAIIGLGGLFAGIGSLLGYIPIPRDSETPDWQFYGMLVLSLLFAGWLAWNGLNHARNQFCAVFAQPLIFEDVLEERSLVERPGVRGNYHIWVLNFAERTWEIPKRDVERTSFSTRVTVGRQIRIQYRQGTKQVTHLWVRPKK